MYESVQDFNLEFKNKSCYISLPEKGCRKKFKMSAKGRKICKKAPVEQTSCRNLIGLTSVWLSPRNHLGGHSQNWFPAIVSGKKFRKLGVVAVPGLPLTWKTWKSQRI